MDAQIAFTDALRRVFPTAVASYLAFRGLGSVRRLCATECR